MTAHEIEYYVNDERQTTLEHTLTMAQIVERAEFTPATDYELEDDKNHKVYKDPAAEVHLHEGQRFTVTYTGVTPTS